MIGDTIFALASPRGAAARGVIRISGPEARAAAGALLGIAVPAARAALEASCPIMQACVPCLVLVMPGGGSYTGEDVVELHLPGSPLLLDHVQSALRATLREAAPGEFTRRAFENGKLDLAAAEAVVDLIHAASVDDRRHALAVLTGGLAASVAGLRERVQDVLASIESGLDFTEGETGSVSVEQWLPALRETAGVLRALHAGWPRAGVGGELLLLGATNAGKSSLCNALAPEAELLVSAAPGTTRDVIAVPVGGVTLLDGPGDLAHAAGVDEAALALRDRVAQRASAAIVVVDASDPRVPRCELPVAAVVVTKIDLAPAWSTTPVTDALAALPGAPCFAVSSVSGEGLAELRAFLGRLGGTAPRQRGRVADALARAMLAVEEAVAAAEQGIAEELVAVDLGEALAALDDVHGRSSPEDLLDRVFARFCLGK